MNRKKVIVILAGNYPQFREYIRERKDGEFVFASDVQRIRGLTADGVERTGTWFRRPDVEELERVAAMTLRRS